MIVVRKKGLTVARTLGRLVERIAERAVEMLGKALMARRD